MKKGWKIVPEAAIVLVLTLVLFGAVIFQFRISGVPAGIPEAWSGQFFFLTLLGFCSALLSIAFCGKRWSMLSFGLMLIAALISVTPEGERIGIRLCLFTAAGLIGGICVPFGYNVLAGLSVAISALASIRGVIAWEQVLASPKYSERIGSILPIVAVSVTAVFFSSALRAVRKRDSDIQQLENTITQLTSANVGFQEYARYVEEHSREVERKRITREIHDVIGYTLTTVIMLLREARLTAGKSGRIFQILGDADRQAKEGLEETRRSLRLLRSIDAITIPLHEALEKLAESFSNATGIAVKVDCGNAGGDMGAEIGSAVIRMVQEGMTNALKHGMATGIDISLWINEKTLIVDVVDNGRGDENHNEGIGLAGMRERIEAIGGEFRSGSAVGGFKISARIPMVRGETLKNCV